MVYDAFCRTHAGIQTCARLSSYFTTKDSFFRSRKNCTVTASIRFSRTFGWITLHNILIDPLMHAFWNREPMSIMSPSSAEADNEPLIGQEGESSTTPTPLESEAAPVVTFEESTPGNIFSVLSRRSPSNNSDFSASGRRLRPFISRHRKELDRIKGDVAHPRAHPVPELASSNNNLTQAQDEFESASFARESYQCCSRLQNSILDYFYSKSRSDWVETLLPAWRWLKVYDVKSTLLADLIAGLSVGVMVIPQGMSYAKLAGLPVQYGLYSALMPVYAYALFGSSRQLAVGPVAIVSLLLNAGLVTVMVAKGIEIDDPTYQSVYNRLVIQTSFLVGLITLFMGIARLGFVTIFLSHAVISGFTTGAAVVRIARSKLNGTQYASFALINFASIVVSYFPLNR